MIWVRSCGKIHEFENGGSWNFGDEYLFVLDKQSDICGQFCQWDWVRYADEGTELLDDTQLKITEAM